MKTTPMRTNESAAGSTRLLHRLTAALLALVLAASAALPVFAADTAPRPGTIQFCLPKSCVGYAGQTTSVSSGYFSLMAVSKFAFAVSSSTLPVK